MVRPELIAGVIGSIYEGPSDLSAWPRAIEQLRLLFHGSQACFARFGPDIGPDDVINPQLNAEFQSRYLAEFAGGPTELGEALHNAPVGAVHHDHTLVGGNTLRRSRFWNDWMAPQDMYGGLGSKVLTSGPSFWHLDVQRGRHQSGFEAADIAAMQLIVSHLDRATAIGRKFNSALASAHAHLQFGVIIVDAGLRVLDINAAAERVMACHGSPLRLKRGVLSAANSTSNAALQQLVMNACVTRDGIAPGRGGDLMVRGGDGENIGIDVAVSIAPIAAVSVFPRTQQAIVYLRDMALDLPDGFEDQMRQFFDFTPAEARLAAALASGMALKTAAVHQGIRFSTARSYLEGIFRKTRTRQQSQLVALLKNTQPLISRG